MMVERDRVGGNKGGVLFEIQVKNKWRTGSTYKRESKKDGSDGPDMGNRKKKIWRELEKEDGVVRLVGGQCNRIWSGDMELEGVGGSKPITRKVHEMDIRD